MHHWMILNSFMHWINIQIQLLTRLLQLKAVRFSSTAPNVNTVTTLQGQFNRTPKTMNPDEWYNDYGYLEPWKIGSSMKIMNNIANKDIVHQGYIHLILDKKRTYKSSTFYILQNNPSCWKVLLVEMGDDKDIY